MRSGYWRLQLGRLRHKLAVGENAYSQGGSTFVVDTLCADEDSVLDQDELRLAADACGNWLALEPRTTLVTLVDESGAARHPWGVELAAFIDALHAAHAQAPYSLELGPVVEEWDEDAGHDRHDGLC
jgi:hypothetical protein